MVAAQPFAAHPDVDELIVVWRRDETARGDTEAWLTFNEIPFDRLLLRRTGDQRANNIVEAEIHDAHIEPHLGAIGVVDDRRSVVEMWRSRGLVRFQVAEGDFSARAGQTAAGGTVKTSPPHSSPASHAARVMASVVNCARTRSDW